MTETSPRRRGEPIILRQADFDAHLPAADVLKALREAFAGLAEGTTVQPPQVGGLIPGHADVIWYPGILGQQGVFGAKLSAYFPGRKDGPQVAVWTILISSMTGAPILLCESKALTTERTAATTTLAVQILKPAGANRLAIFGVGAVGMAHLRFALAIHDWSSVFLYSRGLERDSSLIDNMAPSLRDRVKIASSAENAVRDSDVVLLCTSSAEPVIDYRWLRPGQLVTSITTDAPRAHEIASEALTGLDVYCDYRATTPAVAGEMVLAALLHGWSPESIKGDLPELVSGKGTKPSGKTAIFFRSVGLGIEDLAIASALLKSPAHLKQN